MDNTTPRSVEAPEALSRASKRGREGVMHCPCTLGAAQWCYERMKRSTEKVRIEASLLNLPAVTRQYEFQKLVDMLKADSLLMCAFAAVDYDTFTLTFKNGSVIVFE